MIGTRLALCEDFKDLSVAESPRLVARLGFLQPRSCFRWIFRKVERKIRYRTFDRESHREIILKFASELSRVRETRGERGERAIRASVI
jgi:hypothetical protein